VLVRKARRGREKEGGGGGGGEEEEEDSSRGKGPFTSTMGHLVWQLQMRTHSGPEAHEANRRHMPFNILSSARTSHL